MYKKNQNLLRRRVCRHARDGRHGTADGFPPHEPPQRDMTIDAAVRARVVDSVIAQLDRAYVFPDQARAIGEDLRARLSHGDFDTVASGRKFAETLTGILQDRTHDKHLEVRYFEEAIKEGQDDGPSPEQQADEALHRSRSTTASRTSAGFASTSDSSTCMRSVGRRGAADRIAAAMTLLGDTDALIVDLRECHGGDPETVMLAASYLFDRPTHLSDIYFRDENRTEERWTAASVPSKRYGQARRLYLLTSRETASGCEDFAYALKNAGRATLVGETTAGAAHARSPRRVDAHFMMFVPSGRPISPVTRGDWEGVGVVPDIETPAPKAIDAAQVAILKELLPTQANPMRKNDMQKRIDELR